jgi:signal transduction histidine kinase
VRTISDVPAARQRPPLTKRLSPRHWAALDYAAAGLLGLILFGSVRKNIGRPYGIPYGILPFEPLTLTGPIAMLLVAVAVVAVGLRRRRPVFMLGVLLAGSLIMTTLTGSGNSTLTYFLPVAYVLYLVAATYERKRVAVRVIIAVFATLFFDAALMDLTGEGPFLRAGLFSVMLAVVVVWSTGYIVRERRGYAVRLQDEAASKAVTEERLRIARELHDVVAHSMSVIAVQAGYGQYVIDSRPADARSALGAIQVTSREALDEMRRMLGALRHADETDQRDGPQDLDGAPLYPAPGLADLDRLLSRTASAGVRVDVTRCGQPRELPASIDMSAYRIIQEALTNVVKHARTSSCQVLIGYGLQELILEVMDNGAGVPELASVGADAGGAPVPGWSTTEDAPFGTGGHGIIGMRERVSLLGGEFSAGPRPGYGFQVSAHIPVTA